MTIFRLYPGLNMSFVYNSVRKNPFLSACFCWENRLFLQEMDQKIKIGGTIDYGDSYLEFLFRHFKVFRLHVKLRDAAGTVRAHIGKSHDYCYMIARGPNSCLLGHVSGILFCLYVKLFLHYLLSCVESWKQYDLHCTRY